MMLALISQFKTIPVLQNLQTGKTIVITGANSGLGLEAARHFTRLQAARIILACRDVAKGNAAVTTIRDSYPNSSTRLDVWQLDLGVFDNVKTFAARAEDELGRLDVLLSNASIAPSAYSETGEGWESTLAVNVIGTSLLAVLLLPKMRKTATQHKTQTHLTITSSAAGSLAFFNERKEETIFKALNANRSLMDRYNVSKLLQAILTRCLAAAARDSARGTDVDVIINSVHPGLCQTQLFRAVPFPVSVVMRLSLHAVGRTPEVGSRCLVAGALAGPESHGKYMEDCAIADYPSIMNGDAGAVMQAKVWQELLAILEDIRPDISKLI